ncbi:hypothetical protein PSTH1771_10040 [Pseudomonas syringae pv. theae]|uniref:hypothetical protein n=1 Tax=Pseudomonas syringae TaxID=317 RepID=UPI0023D6857E|nr:hypothetical protein [Pseudomonas syringae]GKS05346.1 hypothetical protein PSTH1771_10040 [Pseudomonas syringae pv. theae]
MSVNNYSLDSVLEYENPQLVYYFSKVESLSVSKSSELFIDLKKWLWLCSKLDKKSVTVYLFEEQRLIDSYWHCFLLFSNDYIVFCNRYLGGIVCHLPNINIAQSAGLKADRELRLEMKGNLALLKHSMEEVQRVLGVETMLRWYEDIPNWRKRSIV